MRVANSDVLPIGLCIHFPLRNRPDQTHLFLRVGLNLLVQIVCRDSDLVGEDNE
jgi:hypothetical protein